MANRLAEASSPYLLQHRDNPVHWQEWGAAALAEARARNVPVLLSVGYAACHWCHVMAHESFEDATIADAMNRDFVCIKVDREERPDIDSIYQQALAALGEQGGWPLTMFLFPGGEPFWGGTYFPPSPRYGRAGLPQVLEQITRLWRDEPSTLERNRAALADALQSTARSRPDEPPEPSLAIGTARRLAEHFDKRNGGLGGAPKFPQAPVLGLLWQVGLGVQDTMLTDTVLHTLARISQGGIYDHLGGGFERYSVDARWLVPHFEKMLYDNAQLLPLLADAWARSGNDLYRTRAQETVDWLKREMMVGDGFACSLDADSDGAEGRFYVWSRGEIDRVLGADAEAFCRAYDVTAAGNWEGVCVLNRLHEPGLPSPADETMLRACRRRLLDARERRNRPIRDDKVLADWNGLMIAGLSQAAFRLGEPSWQEMARRAFAWVVEHLGDGERLSHSWREGKRLPATFLDDYAQMTLAAVTLFEHGGDPAYLDRARAWIDLLDREYVGEDGGYFMTASGAADVVLRVRPAEDGPVPSGNAGLLHALARLHAITGDDAHRRRAEGILRAFSTEIRRNPYACTALQSGHLLLAAPVQVVFVGQPGLEALRDAVAAMPVANVTVQWVPAADTLPAGHPASGKAMVNGRAAAYICVGNVCRPPIVEASELRRELVALKPLA